MNSSIDLEMLESMRYSDMQKLAKSLGIKANVKMDKLLKALKEHISSQTAREKAESKKSPENINKKTKRGRKPNSPKAIKVQEKKDGENKWISEDEENFISEDEEVIMKTETTLSESPRPIPPRKFFSTPTAEKLKSRTPLQKRFTSLKASPMTTGVRRLSQLTPKGMKARGNMPCTPASQQKSSKRPHSALDDSHSQLTGSAKRQKRSQSEVQVDIKPEVQERGGTSGHSVSKPPTPASGKRQRGSVGKVSSKPLTPVSSKLHRRSSGKASSNPLNSGSGKRHRRSSGKASSKPQTPGSERRQSLRRRTFEMEEASPGVRDIIGALKPEMTVQEMKNSLMQNLEKKVQIQEISGEEKPISQIPRFVEYLAAKRKAADSSKKPITPGNKDWSKVHGRHFSKMDSLSSYLEKKRQRQEALTNSMKKAKQVADQTRSAIKTLKECQTSAKKVFEPKVTALAQVKTNFAAMKSPANTINVTLTVPSSGSKENKARKSTAAENRKSGISEKRKSAVTPFKADNMNTSLNSTLNSTTKSASKFDLHASLARPMTWKPHTGKLKPFNMANLYKVKEVRENKGNIKEVKVTSREERRFAAQHKRADKRLDAQMKRRGINA